MKVSVNVSKKCMIIVSIAVFAMLVVCICFLARWFISVKDYEFAKGKITSVSTELVYNVGAESQSKYYEVGIDYKVDDIIYHATDYYRIKIGLKEGKTVRVLYNPQNPQEIKENNQMLVFITAVVFLFFAFSLFLTTKAE